MCQHHIFIQVVTHLPIMYFKKFGSLEIIQNLTLDKCKFHELEDMLPFWQVVVKSYSKLNDIELCGDSFKSNIFSQQMWGN